VNVALAWRACRASVEPVAVAPPASGRVSSLPADVTLCECPGPAPPESSVGGGDAPEVG
jgi:hypothetical protein